MVTVESPVWGLTVTLPIGGVAVVVGVVDEVVGVVTVDGVVVPGAGVVPVELAASLLTVAL